MTKSWKNGHNDDEVEELSDSSTDSNVIIVSDSDETEEEFDSLMSVARYDLSAKHQQHHATDQYAAAVAAVFLNTTSKTAQIPRDRHNSSLPKPATDTVRDEHGSQCSNVHADVAELLVASDDITAVSSSEPLSQEHVTCAVHQNNVSLELVGLQPIHSTHTNQQPSSSASEADEEVKLDDHIASELNNELDSTACNELSEMLSPDKCGSLSDLCNGSFLGDLSFINECLVEDCGSPQLLEHAVGADDVFRDIQDIHVNNQSIQLNESTSEVSSNHDVTCCVLSAVDRSAGLSQVATAAAAADEDDDDDVNAEVQQSVASFQQCVLSYSQTSVDSSSVNCEHTCKPANHIVSILHQTAVSDSTPVSVGVSSLQSVSSLTPEMQHTLISQSQSSLLNSDDHNKPITEQLDVNANELVNQTGTNAFDSDKLLVSGPDMKLSGDGRQDSCCDVLAVEVDSSQHLMSADTRKRLLPEEFSHALCKRFRADSDWLSAEWLKVLDGSMCDAASDTSAACSSGQSQSDVSVASSGCDEDVLKSPVCCCCNLPCDMSSLSCTAGHACCQTCLQRQVKRLLSSPSKESFQSFRCMTVGCKRFYSMTRLRSSLPQMVVDVLEEKMEQEYRAGALSLLNHINNNQVLSRRDDEDDDDVDDDDDDDGGGGGDGGSTDRNSIVKQCHRAAVTMDTHQQVNANDDSCEMTMNQTRNLSVDSLHSRLPQHWTSINGSQDYSLVAVSADTVEYHDIAKLFYHTMTDLNAIILRIHRLQNPVLWQFYAMQKKQREIERQDDEVKCSEVAEKTLFHGIKWKHLHSVCRSNIDWRTMGFSHGVMFGEGTYFARDASYAHEYTDVRMMKNETKDDGTTAAAAAAAAIGDNVSEVSVIKKMSNDSNVTEVLSLVADDSDSKMTDRTADTDAGGTDASSAADNTGNDSEDVTRQLRVMVAARVYVGRYTVGRRTYRKPPALDPSQPFAASFDSCVNYIDNPTLFVVFDSSQCYPEYFITYCSKSE